VVRAISINRTCKFVALRFPHIFLTPADRPHIELYLPNAPVWRYLESLRKFPQALTIARALHASRVLDFLFLPIFFFLFDCPATEGIMVDGMWHSTPALIKAFAPSFPPCSEHQATSSDHHFTGTQVRLRSHLCPRGAQGVQRLRGKNEELRAQEVQEVQEAQGS